jgi:hypothetical protein
MPGPPVLPLTVNPSHSMPFSSSWTAPVALFPVTIDSLLWLLVRASLPALAPSMVRFALLTDTFSL